jgi:hypothetical protein
MRRLLSISLLALLAAAVPAVGAELPVRLVSPAAGTEVTAGSYMTLEWEAAELLPGVEEWEAFLSADGGQTWPVRLTPHLDTSIRRLTVRMPDLPTPRARLLLRFGDERREIQVDTPGLFSILPGPGMAALELLEDDVALTPGERARPQDPGVVVWVEGARDGSHLREVVATAVLPSVRAVESAASFWLPLAGPGSARAELPRPALAAFEPAPPAHREVPAAEPAALQVADVRTLIHRYNE